MKTPFQFLFSLVLVFSLFPLGQSEAQVDKAHENKAHENKAHQNEAQEKMETQFLMSKIATLAYDEELRKELEVVDRQAYQLKELAKNHQSDTMKFYTDNSELISKLQEAKKKKGAEHSIELAKKFNQKKADFAKTYMDRLTDILLPHQVDRLKQLVKQQRIRLKSQFSDEFGMAASLADELGLDAEQKKSLNEAIKIARKEYYDSVAAAKKKAHEKIQSTLTAEQQKKMKEMVGEIWDQDAGRRGKKLKAFEANQNR